jgi:hypothetical protein
MDVTGMRPTLSGGAVVEVDGLKTVLLIENNPATLVAQSLILRCFGYTVLEASNPDEAWCVAASILG